jgi:RNA polymerase sigma-70 factor, ECF subfamily
MIPTADTNHLQLAIAGQEDALRELVRRYHDRVYRFGVQACRDRFDADDVVQQAFMTLARRPDVAGSASVLAWLLTVVRNACIGMLRLSNTQQRVPLSLAPEALEISDDALTPEASLERFRLVSQVHKAIADLDEPGREVILLRDIEGLSGEETAAQLKISLASMKSRLLRARNEIKDSILAQRAEREI